MNKCKKCNKEHDGLFGSGNYCSRSCANSRERTNDVRKKISESVKKHGYLQSEKWKSAVAKSNKSEDVIQKKKQTWVEKRNHKSAHISSLKRWYLEDKDSCENCGLSEWVGLPITLEVHHRDSNKLNNSFDNFQALCPNCHSLTVGWRGRK